MEMTALRELHRSMLNLRLDMQQFRAATGAASFDCLFSTRDDPFKLSMTSRGKFPKFIQFNVLPGYHIKDYIGDMYADLVEALRVDGRVGGKIIPKEFLAQLNSAIPRVARVECRPAPSEIIRLRPDITEHRDRPYFDSWIYWDQSVDAPRSPSEENLQKTLLLLGKDAYSYSLKQKASSRWSVHWGWARSAVGWGTRAAITHRCLPYALPLFSAGFVSMTTTFTDFFRSF